MSYINPTPGVAHQQVIVELDLASASTLTGNIALTAGSISVPAIQKLTVNTSNGTFEWSQLDSRAKKVVATVSTNSLVTDIVVDRDAFFGNTTATSGSLKQIGILGVQSAKTKLAFKVRMDGDSTTGAGDTISGVGYITQLAPTISADQPVWTTPLTLVVDGDFVVTAGDIVIGG
jgi:hypothetical protein